MIQSLNTGTGQGTHRIVRIINAPQIIATQSRGGITTGATVQLQAIPVTGGPAISGSTSLNLPQQPLPLVQQIGTRQIGMYMPLLVKNNYLEILMLVQMEVTMKTVA